MACVPAGFRDMLDSVSIAVLDRPTPAMIAELRKDGLLLNEDGTESDGSDLCGLHTGTALTERSVQDSFVLPDQIHLFREGIASLVTEDFDLTWGDDGFEEELYEEIRITLLHEVGHHFGLKRTTLRASGTPERSDAPAPEAPQEGRGSPLRGPDRRGAHLAPLIPPLERFTTEPNRETRRKAAICWEGGTVPSAKTGFSVPARRIFRG